MEALRGCLTCLMSLLVNLKPVLSVPESPLVSGALVPIVFPMEIELLVRHKAFHFRKGS